MSQLSVEQINDETRYERLVVIPMTEIVIFVSKYYYKTFSPVIAIHYLLSIIVLGAWLWAGWQAGDLDAFLTSLGWGVLAFLVLLPLHEWLHGIGYQFFGAKDVRYRFVLKKMVAYAVAHNFVADRREFIWVALLPSLVINSLLVVFAILFPAFRLEILAALLLHIGGASGDFALLNYLWVHRERSLYTYDDADAEVSYFYAERE